MGRQRIVDTERRRVGVLIAVAVALGGLFSDLGCLFPDLGKFDDGTAARNAAKDGGSSGQPRDDDGGVRPTSSVGIVACGFDDAGPCRLPGQYCCLTVGGPACQDIGGITGPSSCPFEGLGEGRAFLCDGAEDCPPGQACCYTGAADSDGVYAKCTASCGGRILCNTTTSQCPEGMSCGGTVALSDFKACQ